jgi:hypothetical protein
MDPGALALLIPVIALAIGFVVVLKMPSRAFGHRSNPQLEERVEALEQQLGTVRQELTEAQERLDFAERLLARADEARQLEKRR